MFRRLFHRHHKNNVEKRPASEKPKYAIHIPGTVKALIAWSLWLFFGTLFYAERNRNGWGKGFYMAVNVGYSIGWGFPVEKDDDAKWFSVCYLLIGASFVAAALGYFAQAMVDSSKSWYAQEAQRELDKNKTKYVQYLDIINEQLSKNRSILVWILWLASMTAMGCFWNNWSFIDGFYFAVSSLSTGGLFAIPQDSSAVEYAITALFACTGVPIMAMAMARLASDFVVFGDPNAAEKAIYAKVTRQEVAMMQKYQLDDGDGEISKAEFILLCAVRLGALDPKLVAVIHDRFDELDADKSGTLDYDEICEELVARELTGKLTDEERDSLLGPMDNDTSSRSLHEDGHQPEALQIHVIDPELKELKSKRKKLLERRRSLGDHVSTQQITLKAVGKFKGLSRKNSTRDTGNENKESESGAPDANPKVRERPLPYVKSEDIVIEQERELKGKSYSMLQAVPTMSERDFENASESSITPRGIAESPVKTGIYSPDADQMEAARPVSPTERAMNADGVPARTPYTGVKESSSRSVPSSSGIRSGTGSLLTSAVALLSGKAGAKKNADLDITNVYPKAGEDSMPEE